MLQQLAGFCARSIRNGCMGNLMFGFSLVCAFFHILRIAWRHIYSFFWYWFIGSQMIGWYEDNWYTLNLEEEALECTVDQMRLAAEGHLTTEAIMWYRYPNNTKTKSGMVCLLHFQLIFQDSVFCLHLASICGFSFCRHHRNLHRDWKHVLESKVIGLIQKDTKKLHWLMMLYGQLY